MTDASDSSFPLLSEIVTPGNPTRARQTQGSTDDPASRPGSRHDDDFDLPTLTDRLEHLPKAAEPAEAPAAVPSSMQAPTAYDEDGLPMLSEIVADGVPKHPGIEVEAPAHHEAPPRSVCCALRFGRGINDCFGSVPLFRKQCCHLVDDWR